MKKAFGVAALVLGALLLVTETGYWLGYLAGQAPVGDGSCVVLILGYPTARDGTHHPVQRLRVEAGMAAFQTNQCARIVFSGGAVENVHVEAESMAEIARALGASEEDLVIESRAQTTWENIGCAAPYLQEYDRILIVSDSLHVHRAKRYACRQSPSLCPKVHAIGAYEPFALLWWKIPAAAYELRAKLRDFAIYERASGNNTAPCPNPMPTGGTSAEPPPNSSPQLRFGSILASTLDDAVVRS